jgi:2-aminoadipate transaminase
MAEMPIIFTRGVPPTEAFPTEQLRVCCDTALVEDTAVVLQYGQQQGYLPLRQLLGAEYGVDPQQVMVGNGSLQLQDLLAAHLVRPGSLVITEQPSYDRAITTFRRRGARVVGIPLEQDGIGIERLEALLARETPAFLYLVPDFQNPAGVTLSLEKRRRIVELAEQHGFYVVEDVPYRRLRYRGVDLPLLREIAPDRVVTMSSFSKLLSPGLRVGYMVAPAPLCTAIARLSEDTYLSPVLPTQAAVAEYLGRGWLDPNVERLKALYAPRWQAMTRAALGSCSSPAGRLRGWQRALPAASAAAAPRPSPRPRSPGARRRVRSKCGGGRRGRSRPRRCGSARWAAGSRRPARPAPG